ncbi:MAG: hypothetical protein WAT12_09465, partial [Candidatus Nitrotoga sp.]
TDKQNTNQSQTNLHLAKYVLEQYLNQLPIQTVQSTGFHFLPANFEIYAYCVASLLKNISAHHPENEGTIRVWTLLTEPIERWYNIASGFNKDHEKFAHSYPWWEEYKKKVTSLCTRGKANNHFVQMRRIVSVQEASIDPAKTRVFSTDETPFSILNARKKISKIRKACPKFLTEIEVALKFDKRPRLDFPIHLIGQCDCTQPEHDDWELLKEHFDTEFHDAVVTDGGPDDQAKGVYCIYDINHANHRYDYYDLFLVDMREVGAGLFGIAYHKDDINDQSGIVFLKNAEIEKQISHMSSIWIGAKSPQLTTQQ